MPKIFLFLIFTGLIFINSCRRNDNEIVTIALSEKFSTLDTLTTTTSEAAAERVRNLLFNSLLRKNEKFEYVGELASDYKISDDGKILTFTLRDNVKFHNGKPFTSADVKYTFAELFKSDTSYKKNAFYDTIKGEKIAHIASLEAPDAKTVVITLSSPTFRNQLLSNLVAIPIIPEGTIGQQATQPIGTGFYKFVNFDQSQNTVEFEANPDYWEGAPKIQKLRLKTITDASSLQAELQSGGVDIAPLPSNLSPDTLNSLGQYPNLTVKQFPGSNIQYLQFNTESAPLNNAKLRQAIAYGIDREKIINQLLSGQATIAYSILPVDSWAYSAGTKYSFDPAKAKQLIQESGYKGEPIKYKYSAGSTAVSQYALAIQNALKDIGLNIEIETLDSIVLRQQLGLGQFQMNTGIWVGGNQDPIFLKDLFTTGKIPTPKGGCCNRSRFSNSEVDALLNQAVIEPDRGKAKEMYVKAQDIISSQVPMFPLWYPANMIVANKRIGNINVSPSGDWNFVKDLTVAGK